MDYTPLISLVIGIFVGILMGLTGAGGGILSVPLLIFFLHLSVTEAAPIALCAVALAASIGAALGLKNKILRYKAASLMALFGLLLSPLGLWLGPKIPNAPLLIVFSCTLFLVATRLFRQSWNEIKGISENTEIPPHCLMNSAVGKLTWTLPCARALIFSGSLAGFLSGLLGVGGGFIIVPALKRYTDLPVQSIVATSLGVLAIITGGSALFSAAAGNLDFEIAAPFVLAALGGLLLGQALGKKMSGPKITQLFALLTLVIACGLLIKGLMSLLG